MGTGGRSGGTPRREGREVCLSLAEAGYQSGADAASMITDAAHMALLMRLERLEVLRQRENAATDLLLLSADVAPAGLPGFTGSSSPSS